MNFERELKKRKTSIRACYIQSDIPYATLYPMPFRKHSTGNFYHFFESYRF